MKASETKFQPIIEGTKQYVVPLFQRAYSWEKKEWEVLWDDIVWLCENEEPKSHFIGSIVTMPTVSVPEGVSKFLLIDGQQRLTTIFVILTLIRDMAEKAEKPELAQEIEKTMLVNQFKKGSDYLKLLPTQIDRDNFRNLIHSEPSALDSRIHQCYQYFDKKIKQSKLAITSINKVLTTRLSVVSIVLEHDDNPHLVFESLNAKGRPLTQADLIRNYFFMRIHVDEQESIHTKYWEPMQTTLKENLTEFIRHYLMRNGSIVKQNEVYFTLKDRIGASDALAALQDIATYAQYYERLLSPENEPEPTIRKAIKRLNRLEVSTAYPFLLSCYHDYYEERLTAEHFFEILKTLENYLIRRFVCSVPTSQLNKIFPLLYAQARLKNSSNLVDGVRGILQSRGYPKDSEFRARLIDTKLYGAGERIAKTKLILETLELAYEHKETPPFENLTIEHVMPQTLTDWWQKHLGEDWQTEYELYLHTLGNLTLTAYNAELSNSAFSIKRGYLDESHLELNKYFQTVTVWNKDSIEARSITLADLALNVWGYFGEEQQGVITATADTVTGRIPKFVSLLGQRYPVASWRDVQAQTLNTISELEPELFSKLADEYPRFISKDSSKFRKSRPVANGYFIEVNISSKDVYKFCVQAIESVGLSGADWFVEAE